MKKLLMTILSLMTLFFILLLYSRFIGTTGLVTHEIALKEQISESYKGLKIIHFSDIHYKKVITEKRVKKVIEEINRNKPDIILFTGDLLDKDYQLTNQDIHFLITYLKKLTPKYGAYAIMGDQDYSNEEALKNIYLQSNITLLKNETTYIYNENNDKISLTGLESKLKNMDIDTAYASLEDNTYHITMVHEPDAILDVLEQKKSSSLILAGHSINGSINLPGIKQLLLPVGAREIKEKEMKNKNIYISNGIGVNNINFRLFNTPSINLYRFQ